MKTRTSFGAIAICILFFPTLTFSYNNGITGRTTSGCGGSGCHSGSQTATTLGIAGATTVLPGSSTILNLTIQNASRPRAGCDIDFVNSSGTKIAGLATLSGQGLSLQSNELVHSSPKTLSSGQTTWQFKLNAPTVMGQYTMRVAGNATSSQSSGDYKMITQTIVVKGLTLSSPSGGESFCAGTTVALQWNAFGVSMINVQLSTDGGSTFTTFTTIPSTNGSNNTGFSLPAVTPPGSTYRVRIVDAADANLFSASQANSTVIAPVVISTQPQPATKVACEGQAFSCSIIASGVSPTYQWRKNGLNLPGQTTSQFSIASVNTASAGVYDCQVTSSCGGTLTSTTVTLTVSPAASISSQPVPLTICAGQPASFSITAVGSAMTYQWTKDTHPINGATQTTYTIPTVSINDTAYYACVVSSSCGNPMTSNSAQLAVLIAPVFTQHPVGTTLCEDAALTLSTDVQLSMGISYQWLRNGIALNNDSRISGVSTNVLSITGLTDKDGGVYAVRAIASLCGMSVQSTDAIVTIQPGTRISVQPLPRAILRNADAQFSVEASGKNIRYQWKKDAVAIGGATNSSLTVTHVQKTNEGLYSVDVSGDCGNATSTGAKLTVMESAVPVIAVDCQVLNQGNVRIGADRIMHIRVSNAGTALMQVSSLSLSGNGRSAFFVDAAPFTLDAAATRVVDVRFHPEAASAYSATLTISSNGGAPTVVALNGNGIEHALSPGTIFMPSVPIGLSIDTAVYICNRSSMELVIDTAKISGNAAAFLYAATPLPLVMPLHIPADSCYELRLRFRPTMQGFNSASLRLSTSQGVETIMMNGAGAEPADVAEISDVDCSIHPNPVSSALSVKLSDTQCSVHLQLVNEMGRVLYDVPEARNTEVLRVDEMPSGAYLLILNDGQRSRRIPFLVVH